MGQFIEMNHEIVETMLAGLVAQPVAGSQRRYQIV